MIQNIGMEGLEIKQITTQLIGKKNLACIFTKVLLHTHKIHEIGIIKEPKSISPILNILSSFYSSGGLSRTEPNRTEPSYRTELR